MSDESRPGKATTRKISIEEVRRSMAGLGRNLGRQRIQSRYLAVTLIEHHLSEKTVSLSEASLFEKLRQVDTLLGMCESLLLDAQTTNENTVRRDMEQMTREMKALIKKRAAERGRALERGIIDELKETRR